MRILPTAIPDVKLIEPEVFGDERGFFFESFNQRRFEDLIGRSVQFVQDNHSRSVKNVLRGLHFQINRPQAKLVRVIAGAIFDVAVDIRKSSPTFGRWVAQELSAGNRRQIWMPEGFAHGFAVRSEYAEVLYKTTDYWTPELERCILWSDSDLAIDWGLSGIEPILSVIDDDWTVERWRRVEKSCKNQSVSTTLGI